MAEQGHRPGGCVRLTPLGCPVALGPGITRKMKSREAQRVCVWLTEADLDEGVEVESRDQGMWLKALRRSLGL